MPSKNNNKKPKVPEPFINISFSCTRQMATALRKRASAQDLTVSQYIRRQVQSDLENHVLGESK